MLKEIRTQLIADIKDSLPAIDLVDKYRGEFAEGTDWNPRPTACFLQVVSDKDWVKFADNSTGIAIAGFTIYAGANFKLDKDGLDVYESVKGLLDGSILSVGNKRYHMWAAEGGMEFIYYERGFEAYVFTLMVYGSPDDIAPVLPAQVILVSPGEAAAGISNNDCDLEWQAAAGASDYELFISSAADFSVPTYRQSRLLYLKHTVPNDILAADTTYYWKVRARNADGNGPWSASRSFSTGAGSADLSLAELAFWGDSALGIIDEAGKVRRWNSQHGLPAYFGQPAAGLQPVNGGTAGVQFDNVDDVLHEQDSGAMLLGDIFHGANYNKNWTVLTWLLHTDHNPNYFGLHGLNGYVSSKQAVYTSAGGDFVFRTSQYYAPGGAEVAVYGGPPFSNYGNWLLNASVWDGLQIKNIIYDKNKNRLANNAYIQEADAWNNATYSLWMFHLGRAIRYQVIFTRALSLQEIEQFFDMTIADIP